MKQIVEDIIVSKYESGAMMIDDATMYMNIVESVDNDDVDSLCEIANQILYEDTETPHSNKYKFNVPENAVKVGKVVVPAVGGALAGGGLVRALWKRDQKKKEKKMSNLKEQLNSLRRKKDMYKDAYDQKTKLANKQDEELRRLKRTKR